MAVDGKSARVLSTLEDTITIEVPDSVAAGTHVRIESSCGDVSAEAFSADVTDVSPALFAAGSNLIPAVASDSSTIGLDNPAERESVISIYFTGFGALNPADDKGVQSLVAPVSVTIGGDEADVLFAAAAAGRPGVTQIKVRIPAGSGISGRLGVQVSVGDTPTPGDLAIIVK